MEAASTEEMRWDKVKKTNRLWSENVFSVENASDKGKQSYKQSEKSHCGPEKRDTVM